MQKSKNIYLKVNFKSINLKYDKVSNNFLSENNQRNVNDVLSVTDNEATRPTFARTRPALHEAENEAGCYKAETENFGLEALTSLLDCHCNAEMHQTISTEWHRRQPFTALTRLDHLST